MGSIVIADEKLLGFATAFSDEGLREVIFFLQDGPATEAGIREFLKIEEKDLSSRLDRLRDLGLLRKTAPPGRGPGVYSLDFSMERFNGYPRRRTVNELSEAMAKPIPSFLEGRSEEIEAVCKGDGISLGRSVEQLLLSAFSSMMEGYSREVAEEDRRIVERLTKTEKNKEAKKKSGPTRSSSVAP